MSILIRTITYASLFIAFVLIYLPAQVLSWARVVRPHALGSAQVSGLMVGSLGAVLALCCVATFAWIGKGTPAPFDPPRRLVIRGPYRFVRNPMYLGAAMALAGAALFYRSTALWAFVAGFLIVTHLFVMLYEEPHLHRVFGHEYDSYCHHIHRWVPRF